MCVFVGLGPEFHPMVGGTQIDSKLGRTRCQLSAGASLRWIRGTGEANKSARTELPCAAHQSSALS